MTEPLVLADISHIELSGGTSAPSEFRILKAGENPTRKGVVVFDDEAAASVMAEFALGGVDLPLDWDHAMASEASRVEDRKAAGWFKPEVRNGELWATEVTWTDSGRKAVEAREWRFTSLWGDVQPLDKKKSRLRLMRLRNVALVNTPATLSTLPLVASEQEATPKKDRRMEIVLTALGVKDEAEAISHVQGLKAVFAEAASATGSTGSDQIIGQLKALKLRADQADELQLKLTAIETQLAEDKRDNLIVSLSEAGKLPPSMVEWAKSVPLTVLTSFGEAAPVLGSPPGEAPKPAITDATAIVLSDEDRKVAKLLGLSEADITAQKKAEIAA